MGITLISGCGFRVFARFSRCKRRVHVCDSSVFKGICVSGSIDERDFVFSLDLLVSPLVSLLYPSTYASYVHNIRSEDFI